MPGQRGRPRKTIKVEPTAAEEPELQSSSFISQDVSTSSSTRRTRRSTRRGSPETITDQVSSEESDTQEAVDPLASSPGKLVSLSRRGRGRPSKNPLPRNSQTSNVSQDASCRGGGRRRKHPAPARTSSTPPVRTLSFPVTENDENEVQCAACGKTMTFRDFRIHNIEAHYNIAMTTDDDTVVNHKFYARKLSELAKLKKIAVFICPHINCTARYKSFLGLAFHLELCGKSAEEVESLKIECEYCHQKFHSQSYLMHKKNVHGEGRQPEEEMPPLEKGNRKSAAKAREVIQNLGTSSIDQDDPNMFLEVKMERQDESNEHVDDDWFSTLEPYARSQLNNEDDDETEEIEDDVGKEGFETRRRNKKSAKAAKPPKVKSKPVPTAKGPDDLIALQDIPLRVNQEAIEPNEDGLAMVNINTDPWDSPSRYYADPLVEFESATFTNNLEPIGSEVIIDLHLPSIENSVEFRTETLDLNQSTFSTTDFHNLPRFNTEIIDSIDQNCLAFTGGQILSMAWHPSGNFLAVSTLNCNEKNTDDDPNLLESKTRRSSILIYCLSKTEGSPEALMNMELIIALNYGYVNHLQWCNYWPNVVNSFEFPFEACEGKPDEMKIGYLGCAMEDSTVRILSLTANDFQLPNNYPIKNPRHRVYTKVPELCLLIDPATKQNSGHCTTFDWHESHRFLVAGYGSGLIAVFDLSIRSDKLKRKISNKRNKYIKLFPFWMIKSHLMPIKSVATVPTDSRYFHTASMDRYLKTWDIELREEIESKYVGVVLDMSYIRGWLHLAVSTDLGAVYGNQNTTQCNYVRFVPFGSTTGRTNSQECFNITSISFYEGMLAQGSESGKVNITYYDEYWKEASYERNKKKKNCANMCKLSIDEYSFKPIPKFTNAEDETINDQLLSAMSLSEDIRLILTITKERADTSNPSEPTPQEIENCIRFYKYLKINKIAWSPKGNVLAVGYKNGMLVLIPASFELLFCRPNDSRSSRPSYTKKR